METARRAFGFIVSAITNSPTSTSTAIYNDSCDMNTCNIVAINHFTQTLSDRWITRTTIHYGEVWLASTIGGLKTSK